jgi:hypothetical protein
MGSVMARRIRIRGIIDVVRLDDPAEIAAVAEDPRLDRHFAATGPLLNRFIARRVRRVLHVDGTPLPSVAPRAAAQRADRQAALAARLDGVLAGGTPAAEHLGVLAEYVRGEADEAALGPAAQEAIGRLFVADYAANAETWRAACILDAAPRNRNPLRAIGWMLTDAVARSRRVLAQAVRDDPAGVHATGIAVHSVIRSLRAMRALWRDTAAGGRPAADVAVARSLRAPETVLRQWVAPSSTLIPGLPAGVLTMFELDAARPRAPDIAFMAQSWSRCPATAWTGALLHAVWERAVGGPASGPANGPEASNLVDPLPHR